MSASQAPAFTAIMFQLAAALEAYEAKVTRVVAQPVDPELYREVTSLMDRMRMYAASVPRLSVPWVEVMIRHFELTHGLWRAQKGELPEAELRRLLANQLASTRHLYRECLRLIAAANETSSA